MRVAVCDDLADVLAQVSLQVEEVPFVDAVTPYNDFSALVNDIRSGIQYDVVFMDIEWGTEEKGINFAAEIFELSPVTKIIFVTGYQEQYAQKIFLGKVNLCGFLGKPIDQEMLIKLLTKVKKEMLQSYDKKLVVSFNGVVTTFLPADILYMESKGHTAFIYSSDGTHLCYERLADLKERLPEQFKYPHKSFLVNMDHIKRIERGRLLLLSGAELPISKGKYTDFKETYFDYIGSNL